MPKKIPEKTKAGKLTGRMTDRKQVTLKKQVFPEDYEEVKRVMAKFTVDDPEVTISRKKQKFVHDLRQLAVFADRREEAQMRLYPSGKLAAHVLGFVGRDDHIGKEGIEKVLQSELTGARGWRIIEIDKGKRERVEHRVQDVSARNGLNAYLTIDSGVQNIAEMELALAMEKHQAAGVTAIVVSPRNGNVLAMANLPNFEPVHYGDFDASARRNRAVTDMFEPGSTFKAVTVSAALNERYVTLESKFNCEDGLFRFGGHVLRDGGRKFDKLSVKEIIGKSSNIGSAKIAIGLGASTLHQYIKEFGFGSRTGIDLTGEAVGIVHPPKKWRKVTISRVPMGQGIAATPLQIVMMMSAIANGGRLMQPRVIDRLEDEKGRVIVKYPVKTVRQVISPTTAKQVTEALKTVIAKGGTARSAELDFYTVAGKTGTAQKAGGGRYIPGKYYTSFVGFLPADKPELCILVAVDEPQGDYGGGKVAAPIFKAIAGRTASYLGIAPDKKPDKLAISGGRGPGRR